MLTTKRAAVAAGNYGCAYPAHTLPPSTLRSANTNDLLCVKVMNDNSGSYPTSCYACETEFEIGRAMHEKCPDISPLFHTWGKLTHVDNVEHTTDNAYVIVMEFVHGRTLAYILREPSTTEVEIVQLIRAIADALGRAQRIVGLLHGDLKPDNIMLPFVPKGHTNTNGDREVSLHPCFIDYGCAAIHPSTSKDFNKCLDIAYLFVCMHGWYTAFKRVSEFKKPWLAFGWCLTQANAKNPGLFSRDHAAYLPTEEGDNWSMPPKMDFHHALLMEPVSELEFTGMNPKDFASTANSGQKHKRRAHSVRSHNQSVPCAPVIVCNKSGME